MMDRDLTKTTVASFLMSIASLRRTDLRPDLEKIRVPVMGMYGDRDNIVNPRQWQPLLKGVPGANIVRWERAQHFVMLDVPQDFMEKLKVFLDDESPAG
jgi:pimeloyl-ACP methyl ester carboxylesterase